MISTKYREKFDKFVNSYEEKHINPWHELYREEFDKLYQNYIDKHDVDDKYTYYYMMNYLIKRLSGNIDQHTHFGFKNHRHLPYVFTTIDDEIYVVRSAEEDLLLSKLIAINGIDIKDIVKELDDISIYGNDEWRRTIIEQHLYDIDTLYSLPSIEPLKGITYTLIDINGNTIEREFTEDYQFNVPLEYSKEIPSRKPNCYYEIINDTIYLKYNSCNKKYKEQVIQVVSELDNIITEGNYNKIIIDLRKNKGGNSNLGNPILELLEKHSELKVISLVNQYTFSSGVDFYETLKGYNAISIGDDVGMPINCYGDNYVLEDDEFNITISHKYFHYDENYKMLVTRTKEDYNNLSDNDKKVLFEPVDIKIIPTLDDYKNDRDPVLEYALNYKQEKIKH